MTPLQQRAFDFIRDRITEAGYSPTAREVAEELRLPSEGSARGLIDALVRMKKLGKVPGCSRNIVLADAPDLSIVGTGALRAELARRGETLDALVLKPLPANVGRPCAATYCQERVTPGKLMCRDHWNALPQDLRTRIFAAFRARRVAEYGELVRQAIEIADTRRVA